MPVGNLLDGVQCGIFLGVDTLALCRGRDHGIDEQFVGVGRLQCAKPGLRLFRPADLNRAILGTDEVDPAIGTNGLAQRLRIYAKVKDIRAFLKPDSAAKKGHA
ncbi:hypothetical protein [Novosphingobium cyanobacteriorum]|uniref:Uncharacterized protein n=1 Tax=Novosphingobium cyanobacteriorum TaxID=3024215 RepID=A0ABT6CL99_9SPHN|nr:hypothetical protein [Novosphingobium cyanobacteriorum]MDF8334691.1 hypothetical protein [Novosphingobium cyanobacteriorum]